MWRFFNDKDALWSRFIRAVHGNSGGIETHSRVSYSSTCLSIVNEVNKMRNKGIDLLKYMKIQVGNGLNTMFWEDVWMGNKNFKTSFPKIYALESDKNLTVADKMAGNIRLIGSPKKTRWIKMVPIKVSILAWKVQFDLLPTLLNLSRRGLVRNIKSRWKGYIMLCGGRKEDEDEAENQNPWAFDDEVADEDEYNDEVADEDEWP
nr:hypothetical protein [Tanacetum cinerariifolium]